MIYSFAPLEGITSYLLRNVHAELFGGCESYYAPFVAPDGSGTFKVSKLQDLLPENNPNIRLVPQILANSAFAFLKVTEQLSALGYKEVNLNIGCPSGTVVSKYKGAGMLRDLKTLEQFLDQVYSEAKISVSVKTRLGISSSAEFENILSIYNKYPISELIIHARDREGQYHSDPDLAAFCQAFDASHCPAITYNGDIFSPSDQSHLLNLQPNLERIMCGRGVIANPALFRVLNGGQPLEKAELKCYHDCVIASFRAAGLNEYFTVTRGKELWHYMICMFADSRKAFKSIAKAKTLADYSSAVNTLFSQYAFHSGNGYSRIGE